MVVTKNQIRPRRKKFRFSNAEILALDTTGFVTLINPGPLGTAINGVNMQIRTNLVQNYSGVGATPYMYLVSDFGFSMIVADDPGATNFTELFTNGPGLILYSSPFPELVTSGTSSDIGPFNTFFWTDPANIVANGGLTLIFNNGGSDLADGDPANYMDIFVDYEIVNL
jgi:hypothetical protein